MMNSIEGDDVNVHHLKFHTTIVIGGLAMKEYLFAMLAGCVFALMSTLVMAEMIS